MSDFYNPRRKRNLYKPGAPQPFRLSRSKLDLFLECPRCFYLDRRLGVGRPPGYPFSLNAAVDTLLKKEFDIYRKSHSPHPLMKEAKIHAVPYAHDRLEEWRDSLRAGVTAPVEGTHFILTGGVDDLWINTEGELIIVDYKATSKEAEVSLDADWQDGYKRQMEIYQWLFRHNGFKVNDTGYFVYANGDAGQDAFNHTLKFSIKIIPYKGNDDWVEDAAQEAFKCLNYDQIPASNLDCDFCSYRQACEELTKAHHLELSKPKKQALF